MTGRPSIPWWLGPSLLITAAACLVASVTPMRARAGARDLEVLTVRADDGTDPQSEACFAGVRRGLRRTPDVHLQNLTPVLKRTVHSVTEAGEVVAEQALVSPSSQVGRIGHDRMHLIEA